MQVILTIEIPESHIVTLPDHVPVGRARLTLEVADPPTTPPAATMTQRGTNIEALVALLHTFPPTGRTREQVDQSLLDDRTSWDS